MANIVGSGGEPERAIQALVSANFFTTLGVQPVLGRGFQQGEDQPGREREVERELLKLAHDAEWAVAKRLLDFPDAAVRVTANVSAMGS